MMFLKLLLLTFILIFLLVIWLSVLKKKKITVDWQLILSYFLFTSWFGMFGEIFVTRLLETTINYPIWEYRILPIHDKMTSSYGIILWGLAGVYVCFYENYNSFSLKKKTKLLNFVFESGYLLFIELMFNVLSYIIFKEYFFYYFPPDLFHFSSLTAIPFWWVGYKMIVRSSTLLHSNLKLNLSLAVMMLFVLYST